MPVPNTFPARIADNTYEPPPFVGSPFGPFFVGDDRYLVVRHITTLFPSVEEATVFKSSDGGVTWSEQDVANRKVLTLTAAGGGSHYTLGAVLNGTDIYVVHDRNPVIDVFDTTTDTWGAQLAAGGPEVSGNTLFPAYGREAKVLPVLRPDGSVLVYATSLGGFGDFFPRSIIMLWDGSAWSTLPNPVVPGGVTDQEAPAGVVVDSNGVSHLFSVNNIGILGVGWQLQHFTIDAANAAGAVTTVSSADSPFFLEVVATNINANYHVSAPAVAGQYVGILFVRFSSDVLPHSRNVGSQMVFAQALITNSSSWSLQAVPNTDSFSTPAAGSASATAPTFYPTTYPSGAMLGPNMVVMGPGEDFVIGWKTHFATPSSGFTEVDSAAIQWSQTGEGKFNFQVPNPDGFGFADIQVFVGAPIPSLSTTLGTIAWVFWGHPNKGSAVEPYYIESKYTPSPAPGVGGGVGGSSGSGIGTGMCVQPNDCDRYLGGVARATQAMFRERRCQPNCDPSFRPFNQMPANGRRFQEVGTLALPADDGADNLVLQIRVPHGYDGVLLTRSHQYTGTGFQEGGGDLTWRLQNNFRWFRDDGAVTITQGRLNQAYDLEGGGHLLGSNQVIRYFVNVAVGAAARLVGGQIICALSGWFYPLGYVLGKGEFNEESYSYARLPVGRTYQLTGRRV